MIPIIVGTKGSMTHYFDEKGFAHAATLVQVSPVFVTQIKTKDTDGYTAIQFGAMPATKAERINKPQRGHLGELPPLDHLTEVIMSAGDVAQYAVGQSIDALSIEPGAHLDATGTTKGKGFQGGVKRHGFHGDKRSHGRKHSERKPGSIGGGGRAGGRVAKGMRMAGRMGGDVCTVKNLEVLAIAKDSNTLIIKGALPGSKGTVIEFYPRG